MMNRSRSVPTNIGLDTCTEEFTSTKICTRGAIKTRAGVTGKDHILTLVSRVVGQTSASVRVK